MLGWLRYLEQSISSLSWGFLSEDLHIYMALPWQKIPCESFTLMLEMQ